MTLPHVDLGNSYQDVSQGANTFAKGLLDQRQRQQQLALQEALSKSQSAHLDAETNIGIPASAAASNASAAHSTALTSEVPSVIAKNTAEAGHLAPVDDVSWANFTKDKPGLRDTPEPLRETISRAWAQGAFGYHPDNYGSVGISPDGNAVIVNHHTGQLTTTDTKMQQKGMGGVLQEKMRLGASNAANAIAQMEHILAKDPNADIKPWGTSIAQGAGHVPVIGSALSGAMEGVGVGAMTPAQQEFDAAMDQMAHNAVGLLPGSRQSIVLFNNLRSAYRPKTGESSESRAFKHGQLHRLKAKFVALARGENIDLSEDFGPEFSNLNQGDPGLAPTTSNPSQPQSSQPSAPNPYGYKK